VNLSTSSSESHASLLQQQVQASLQSGERFLAGFTPDLDERMRFHDSLVVLTDRRVLAWPSYSSTGLAKTTSIWPLEVCALMKASDLNGLGTLELLDEHQRLQVWRYTAEYVPEARQMQEAFTQLKKGNLQEAVVATTTSVCPSCGGGMEPGQVVCPSCAAAPAPNVSKSLWRLVRFAKPRASKIALGFGLTLASTAVSLIPPYLSIPLFNKVLTPFQEGRPSQFELVPWILISLLLAAVATWLLSWAKTYVLANVGALISADLRNQTYAHLQKLSLEFFGGKRTGDLISRVSDDTQRICDFISIQLLEFATDLIMIFLTAGVLFYINPMMALATLLPLPIVAWLIQYVRAHLRHGFAREIAAWAEMVNVLADTIPGIRVVKAFAQENREIKRFEDRNDQVLGASNRVNLLWATSMPIITLLTEIGILVIYAFGAWRVASGTLTVGVLIAFITYISRLYARLDSMSRMLAATQRAAASTHRIFEILDRVPSVAEPVKPIHPGKVQGRIEIRNMSFRYGVRRVLHQVDLKIEPGEMIGLVGPSGSGKSTLVNLVCRFYDTQEGAILVDGVDIRSFPVSEYRSNIGIVLQEPFLFFGTIAENISYGRPQATRSEIIAAARASKAHDFILRLPDGYDSMVGERGQSLSGGERQRISIARALLTDPRILILDEATSAVDTETEREIQEALDVLVRGRTTIAIAHRISTLRKASRIVVLESGKVTEVGSHDDLLERKGTYYRLNIAQQQLAQAALL
jgi:ATP-binding cassette subfamily B protein